MLEFQETASDIRRMTRNHKAMEHLLEGAQEDVFNPFHILKEAEGCQGLSGGMTCLWVVAVQFVISCQHVSQFFGRIDIPFERSLIHRFVHETPGKGVSTVRILPKIETSF